MSNFNYTEIYHSLRESSEAVRINYAIERNYQKVSSLLNRIFFLNKCKEHDIIPHHISRSVSFSSYINISNIPRNKIETIFKNSCYDILKLEIKQSYQSLNKVFSILNHHWNKLKNILRSDLYNGLIKIHMNDYQKYYAKNRQRIINKFQNIIKEKTNFIIDKNYMINLSDLDIPEDIANVLRLGPKFSVYNSKKLKNQIIDMVSDVEHNLKIHFNSEGKVNLKKNIRNEVTNSITNFLNKKVNGKTKTDYVGRLIEKTIKFRENHKNEIVILETDKSNRTAILNRGDYISKMNDILSNNSTFKKLTTNPLNKLEKDINNYIRELQDSKQIDKKLGSLLKSSYKSLPQIYGLIKLHKNDLPLRPVISSIDSPLENLCKYFTNILKPLVKYNLRAKNSYEVVEKLKGIRIDDDEILVSYDIQSMYPSIPRDTVFTIIEKKWETIKNYTTMNKEYFLRGLKLCLCNNYFIFQSNVYEQTSGVAIGSKISPVISEILLDELLEVSLNGLNYKLYIQYVDDSLCILKEEESEIFLNALNGYHTDISFTMEKENKKEINFLDINIKRSESGELKTDLYIKPSKSERMLNFESAQPISQKLNIIKGEIYRIKNICHPDNLDKNYENLIKRCSKNGYPKSIVKNLINNGNKKENKTPEERPSTTNKKFGSINFIPGLSERIIRIFKKQGVDLAVKSEKILRPLYSNKEKKEKFEQKELVYKIECKQCKTAKKPHIYFGETMRPLKIRIREHASSIVHQRLNSALSIHAIDNSHDFDFENTKIVCFEKDMDKRKLKEAANIQMFLKNTINFRADVDKLSDCYSMILTIVNKL